MCGIIYTRKGKQKAKADRDPPYKTERSNTNGSLTTAGKALWKKRAAHHDKAPANLTTITALSRKDASPMESTEEQNISSAVNVMTRGHIPPTA